MVQWRCCRKKLIATSFSTELLVNDWKRKGNLEIGELQLKIYWIASCANVSKDAMRFCISGVTGMFSLLKSSNVNCLLK